MKFALVNGNKTEATKGVKGLCPSCGSELVAKCGEVKIHHWAHKGKRNCDHWWENETEWHRAWKDHFPEDWQEVVHKAEDGEKHIADVKTDQGWVLEFQHSYIKPEELHTRNNFYQKIVWVVDGTRRKRDRKQFFTAIKEGDYVSPRLKIHTVFSDDCSLLREWARRGVSVFFDFDDVDSPEDEELWWLLPWTLRTEVCLLPFSRSDFIRFNRNGATQEIFNYAEELRQQTEKAFQEHQIQLRRDHLRFQLAQQKRYRSANRFKRYRRNMGPRL